MKIKELLIDFYQELKDDNNQIYDINGIRSKISSKAEKLLNIIDKKDQQCMCIDKKIFSFLNFINGYDTPRYEDNMYLFNNADLEREYNMLGDIDLLEGINLEILGYELQARTSGGTKQADCLLENQLLENYKEQNGGDLPVGNKTCH